MGVALKLCEQLTDAGEDKARGRLFMASPLDAGIGKTPPGLIFARSSKGPARPH